MERLDKKFSYNYQVIKNAYPKVSELPEDEVREIIRKYYDATGTHEDSMQAVMNYIREKEPEWKMKYFYNNADNVSGNDYAGIAINNTLSPVTEKEKAKDNIVDNIGAYPTLQKAIRQEGNVTQEDLKNLARRGGFTPLLAPFPIVKDVASLYNNKDVTDKYKHAYINCLNAQRGLMSSVWADDFSGLKEYYDVKSGANTPIASYEDMDANLTGKFLGIKYPEGDCDELVQRYFKKLW